MARLYHLLLATTLVTAAGSPALSALVSRDWLAPGDGLLTLDTGTNLEWLDVSQTSLDDYPGALLEDRFQAVVALTAPGARFSGFSVATVSQARDLAVSGGIVLATVDFATNEAAAQRLQLLIGTTTDPDTGIARLEAVVAETQPTPSGNARLGLTVFRTRGQSPTQIAGANVSRLIFTSAAWPDADGRRAVMLLREIPEPSTSVVAIMATLLLPHSTQRLRRS